MNMDRAVRAVAQWREEMPDLPDLRPMEVLGRLAEAALVIDRVHLTPVIAEFGLQNGEFDVLAALRRSGREAMTPTELFGITMMSSGGITARVDRLEKAGLVQRAPNPADRRGTLVSLTEKGRELIERALLAHLANETRIVSGLTEDELDTLGQLLRKLLTGLESGDTS